MLKYKGGHRVGKGTYWNFSDGTRVDIKHDGILPGDKKVLYRKISSIAHSIFVGSIAQPASQPKELEPAIKIVAGTRMHINIDMSTSSVGKSAELTGKPKRRISENMTDSWQLASLMARVAE